jgi:hypothetical protein
MCDLETSSYKELKGLKPLSSICSLSRNDAGVSEAISSVAKDEEAEISLRATIEALIPDLERLSTRLKLAFEYILQAVLVTINNIIYR